MVEFCVETRKQVEELLMEKGWHLLGEGRHRRTFGHPKRGIVLKVPYSSSGAQANISEFRVWDKHKNDECDPRGFQLARCRLIQIMGLPVIVMEEVETLSDPQSNDPAGLPSWCYLVDCTQVGHTKHGRLVAFDYTYNAIGYWPTIEETFGEQQEQEGAKD